MGRISHWYNDLREKIRPLSFRQKLSYFFTYYKGWLLGLILIIMLGCYIGDFLIQRNKETLLEGFFTNDDYVVFNAKDINEEFSALVGLKKDQNIIMDDELYIATDGSARDYSAASNGKIIAYMSVGELDFVITSKEIYEHYSEAVPMLDISSLLSPGLSEELEPSLIMGRLIDADGNASEPYPTALELSGCKFLRDRTDVPPDTYYLFVPYQAPHLDALKLFIEYLFS